MRNDKHCFDFIWHYSSFSSKNRDTLINIYTRTLTEAEKKRLVRKTADIKKFRLKLMRSIILIVIILIFFGIVTNIYFSLWFFIPMLIVSFFMIWSLFMKVKGVIEIPKNIRKVLAVIDFGIVEVTEIQIDRYIKINNYNDEGNHFIVEHEGKLSMIGGQEFLGIRKLKNKMEHILIKDAGNTGIYDERIKKTGNNLEAYYTFKKGLSEALFNSELWDNLTSRTSFPGKLEDLDTYIVKDKSKS